MIELDSAGQPPHEGGPREVTPATRLRVGLLVDSVIQPAWIARTLRRVIDEGNASIELVVRRRTDPKRGTTSGRLGSWVRNHRFLAHAAYTRLDALWFKVTRDPFAPTDITPMIANVPVIDVEPRQTRYSDFFEDSDVERILRHDLDVALRFGFRILRGRALTIARHGVWSYHHGDNRVYRGGPAGFWEVMEGDPVTGAVLQVLGESLDDGRVLSRNWTRTTPYSVGRNRATYYWQAEPMVARKLRDVAQFGAAGLAVPGEVPAEPAGYSHRLYVAPRNAAMVAAAARLTGRYISGHVRALIRREQWMLGFRITAPGGCGRPDLAPHRYTFLTPPNDRFWADPFPLRYDGRDYVFFEEFVTREGKAHICVMEMDQRGPVGEPRRVLSCDYHLSYPFVFEHAGDVFMIPETATTARVELWRAVRFPDEWTLDRVLIDERPLVDATLARIGDRWWLFAAGTEVGADAWDDLYLYHAATPMGPWRPHRRNPVVTDVRSGRPAGMLFEHRGRWYRPAQDGSRSYGSAITIQRIERLSQDEYIEVGVTRLDPRWRPDVVGIHTINAIDGLSVLDTRRTRAVWSR